MAKRLDVTFTPQSQIQVENLSQDSKKFLWEVVNPAFVFLKIKQRMKFLLGFSLFLLFSFIFMLLLYSSGAFVVSLCWHWLILTIITSKKYFVDFTIHIIRANITILIAILTPITAQQSCISSTYYISLC